MFKFFKKDKPRTIRDTVAQIFCETLDLKVIDPNSNFFELGGDSIQATIAITALSDAGYDLPSTVLFDYPSIDELTAFIQNDALPSSSTTTQTINLLPRTPGKTTQVKASLLQERLWPFELNPDPKRFQLRGEGAVHLKGSLDVKCMNDCLSLVIARHEVLRSSFIKKTDALYVDIHPPNEFELDVLVASGDSIESRRRSATAMVSRFASQVFHLSTPPPFRCVLIKLSEEEHVLAVSMHHIISDGWSMGVFVSEVTQAYSELLRGRELSLPELPYQFAEYAHWHREWLSSQAGKASLVFWKTYLEGLPPALDVSLPAADGDRRNTVNFPVRRQNVDLDAQVQTSLRSIAKETKTSAHAVFMAAVLQAFQALEGARDLPIGIMHANRSLPGTQNLIGFFSTLVLLRLPVQSSISSMEELIDHVREETRRIEPHTGVPIGELIENHIVDTLPRIFVDSVPRPRMPELVDLELEEFPFEHPPLFAVADVAIFLFDDGKSFRCVLGTNEDMYSKQAAQRLSSALSTSLLALTQS